MNKPAPEHLCKTAFVYVRQSTLDQVQHNQESQRCQYRLVERARELGWQDIQVVDDDQGCSGGGSVRRPGFERLLTSVCEARAGAVLSVDASRLARNGREWHTLLELCGLTATLIVDHDGVYDPQVANDRLLLGMKGTLSEMEISLFRQRSQSALQQKAARGALYTTVPVGYRRCDGDRLEKDPDRRVQEAVGLVFKKFRELGSVRQVVLWFRQERIVLPRLKHESGQWNIEWKLGGYGAFLRILTNPTYAGAYAYGKTVTRVVMEGDRKRLTKGCRRAQADWDVLLRDRHEGYITWDEYTTNQSIIAENANMKGALVRGAVRRGEGLLAGLLRCRRCARKIHVAYSGTRGDVIRYACLSGVINKGESPCISFGGWRVDQVVSAAVLEAISPLGVEAALRAFEDLQQKAQEVQRQRALVVEQARFEAERARRQFDAVEPENRLVAAELEHRWNEALVRLRRLEDELAEACTAEIEPDQETRATLCALGNDLQTVWNHPDASPELKKRILRIVLKEIVADVVDDKVRLLLHWQGGDHTEIIVQKGRAGHHRWKTDVETERIIRELARLMPDHTLASLLNRLGKRTAKGHRWTQARVCSFRHDHDIPIYHKGERQQRGELTLQEAAERLNLNSHKVRRLIKRGILPARQVCYGAPWIIKAEDLTSEAVKTAVAKPARGGPLTSSPAQPTLDLSTT